MRLFSNISHIPDLESWVVSLLAGKQSLLLLERLTDELGPDILTMHDTLAQRFNVRHPDVKENKLAYLGQFRSLGARVEGAFTVAARQVVATRYRAATVRERIFNAAIFRFRLGSIEIPHFAKISGRHQDV